MTSKKKPKRIYNLQELKNLDKKMILRDSSIRVKVYKSGNSKVVTIPSHFDINPGDELILKDSKKTITATKVLKNTKELETEKKLGAFIGSHSNPNLKNMTVEDLEEMLEGIYDD